LQVSILLLATISHYDKVPTTEAPDKNKSVLHEKLDLSMASIISGHLDRPNLNARVINALRREGIYTLRDVLVYGKSSIEDIRNMGAGSLNLIEECIKAQLGSDVTWLDEPTVQDIAKWCTNLSQVPSGILPLRSPWHEREFLIKSSVQRLLTIPDDELALSVGRGEEWDDESKRKVPNPDYERATEVRAEAGNFADKFTSFKTR